MPIGNLRTYEYPDSLKSSICLDYEKNAFVDVANAVLIEVVQMLAAKFVELHGDVILQSIDKDAVLAAANQKIQEQIYTDLDKVVNDVRNLKLRRRT